MKIKQTLLGLLVEFNENQDKVSDLECDNFSMNVKKINKFKITSIQLKEVIKTENLTEESEMQLLQELSQLMSKGKENK